MSIVYEILKKTYDINIAENTINSYKEIEYNFLLGKWKSSELDAGHFVESLRRLIEFELFGNYTPFDKKLSNFTDEELKKYESGSGNESYRILIPRILKSIYNIRNKRGVGHITTISPNEMDSTYILYSVKWVLAELIRLKSSFSIPETQKLIDAIVERRIDIIWKFNGTSRILNAGIKTEEKILILLYDTSPQSELQLLKATGYTNSTNFAIILLKLHKLILINYEDGFCMLSPKGLLKAEKILVKLKFSN